MTFERDISLATFGAFAQPCTLDGVAGEVIVDRSVSYIDDDGQVRDRITQVSLDKAFAAGATHGANLVADGRLYRLGRRVDDDGYIVTFEVTAETEAEP